MTSTKGGRTLNDSETGCGGTAKGDAYRAETHPTRRADPDDRITDFDAHGVVRKLVDGRVADVA